MRQCKCSVLHCICGASNSILIGGRCCPARLQSPRTSSKQVFTEEEVAEHASKDTGVWVTYKGAVYDVTNWVRMALHA